MKLTEQQREDPLPRYISPEDYHEHPSLADTDTEWLHGVDYLVMLYVCGRRMRANVARKIEFFCSPQNAAERAYIAGRVRHEIRG